MDQVNPNIPTGLAEGLSPELLGVAQNEQQPNSDNTDAQGGLFSPILDIPASSDKTSLERAKILMDLIKGQQTPPAVQSEQYKLANQPDSGLVQQESQDLQNFLHQLFLNISGNPVPNQDRYQLDPNSVKVANEAQKVVSRRLQSLEQAMKEIPTNPTTGVPKSMENYYNSLLVERNLLTNLGQTLSTVNEKNPFIPESAMQGILNQAALFGQGQQKGSTNPYGFGGDQITQAILRQMGTGISPEMKTLQDWIAYTTYIDKFMKPYVQRASQGSNMGGENFNDIAQRQAFIKQNGGPQNEREKVEMAKSSIGQSVGKGIANFVNMTQTLDPKLRSALWNMLPIWAASQGLNWQDLKKYAVEHANKISIGSKEAMAQGAPSPTFAPQVEEARKQKETKSASTDNESKSRLGSFMQGIGNTGKGLESGVEQGIQTGLSPATGFLEYITDPNRPSYAQSVKWSLPNNSEPTIDIGSEK